MAATNFARADTQCQCGFGQSQGLVVSFLDCAVCVPMNQPNSGAADGGSRRANPAAMLTSPGPPSGRLRNVITSRPRAGRSVDLPCAEGAFQLVEVVEQNSYTHPSSRLRLRLADDNTTAVRSKVETGAAEKRDRLIEP